MITNTCTGPLPPPIPAPAVQEPAGVLWIACSRNALAGPVVAGYVGRSLPEARASCERAGCGLLGSGGRARCYSWQGNGARAFSRIADAARKSTDRYTLRHALLHRSSRARYARLGMLGDPGVLRRSEVEAIEQLVRGAGLGMVAHAHHAHARATHLRGLVMSSTDSPDEADQAIADGWRTTTILLPGMFQAPRSPAGHRISVCPALLPGRPAVCNSCGMCDPTRPGPAIIGYPRIR